MPSSPGAARCCPYCQQVFLPSLYCPGQLVCGAPDCQRQRRREYHRQKLVADAVYRQVCRDSQRNWQLDHPLYQQQYRQSHPASAERNRRIQPLRDQKRRLRRLEKNNLAFQLTCSSTEVWLTTPATGHLEKNILASAKLLIFQGVVSNPPPCPRS
jgi:hypothetical protein